MTKHLLRTALFGIAATGWSQSLSGLWDATVQVNDLTVPFRIELTTSSTEAKGAFFNGDDRVASSAGTFQDRVLHLEYDYPAPHLRTTPQDDGTLPGDWGREGPLYPFHARRFAPSTLPADDVPPVAGLWQVAVNSPKGESAWRLIIRQSGAEGSAAILRVGGDTRLLTGAFHHGKFVLRPFSGPRPPIPHLPPHTPRPPPLPHTVLPRP